MFPVYQWFATDNIATCNINASYSSGLKFWLGNKNHKWHITKNEWQIFHTPTYQPPLCFFPSLVLPGSGLVEVNAPFVSFLQQLSSSVLKFPLPVLSLLNYKTNIQNEHSNSSNSCSECSDIRHWITQKELLSRNSLKFPLQCTVSSNGGTKHQLQTFSH